MALLSALLQFNKVSVNGRLQRWPRLAKGFCLALGTGFAALLAHGGYYRALAGGATISGDRPVRREFERSWPRAGDVMPGS